MLVIDCYISFLLHSNFNQHLKFFISLPQINWSTKPSTRRECCWLFSL